MLFQKRMALPVVMCLFTWMPLSAREDALTKLPRTLQKTVREQLLPVVAGGNPVLQLQEVTDIVPKLNEAQTKAVDAFLAEHKLPALAVVVVDARSTLMGYGFAAQMPGASPKEAELLVPEVTRRMEEALVESRQFHQKANGDKVNQNGAIDFAANENRLYEMRPYGDGWRPRVNWVATVGIGLLTRSGAHDQ
ncbi:MAG: hypothetical protein R3C99_06195 [Pirellulaceae bacterium]